MSEATVLNKRDQVKECIERGDMTKAEIAELLGMSVASVSTQMTYLRWMDNYILTDENKLLSFTDKETFEKLEAEKKANKSTKSTITRTPEERAQAVAKTIATQEKQLAKWQEKVVTATAIAAEHPEDDEATLAVKEAIASVAILEVKLARNNTLLESLPDIKEVEEDTVGEDEVEEDTVGEDEVATDDLL